MGVYPDTYTVGYDGYDRLHSLYPELLKRLDDSSDAIRMTVLQTWLAYAKCISAKTYDVDLYRAHMDHCIKGMIIHLDDQDEAIQGGVDAVLREFAKTTPGLVFAAANAAKHKHRDAEKCIALAQLAEG